MLHLFLEFIMLGIAGGLLGIFYRNCLKPKNMIFNYLYYKIFKPWVVESKWCNATVLDKLKGWVAYPLGYCVYCSSTWITFILCAVYLSSWEGLPKWQDITIGIVLASGVQHIIITLACKFIINNNSELSEVEDYE